MPKILCFCVCDRAGTDILKICIIEAKKTKTRTRFGNCQKPELGWETKHNGVLPDRIDTFLKRNEEKDKESKIEVNPGSVTWGECENQTQNS